jgi:hypothetical protein
LKERALELEGTATKREEVRCRNFFLKKDGRGEKHGVCSSVQREVFFGILRTSPLLRPPASIDAGIQARKGSRYS